MSDDLGCAIISAADEQSWTQASRRSTILQPAAAGPKRRSAFTFIRPRIAAKRTRKRAADYQGLAAAHDNEQGRGDHEKEGTDRTGQRKLQESGLRNASGARTCQGASDRTVARARPQPHDRPAVEGNGRFRHMKPIAHQHHLLPQQQQQQQQQQLLDKFTGSNAGTTWVISSAARRRRSRLPAAGVSYEPAT